MTGWKVLTVLLPAVVLAQKPGGETKNYNPSLTMQECSGNQNCQSVNTKVTLDQNWRWVHVEGGYENCFTGNMWDNSVCPDGPTCVDNCELEGVTSAEWKSTYGITASGDELDLKFLTVGQYATNVGSRTFLLDASGSKYYMFKLLNREFTFDVDVSALPCGINGALYFVEMDADGGLSEYAGNEVGAAYGAGYCDAQCPHDIKFINGEANCEDWQPSDNDVNAGKGKYGSCCHEMDIWESNSVASAYTLHPCNTVGQVRCEGVECGDNDTGDRYNGVCDKDGCDFHNWRLGDRNYFGPGMTVDTNKKITVVTQFLTDDGTDNGELVEVRRLYVQDGKVIDNSFTDVEGVERTDSITEEMCEQSKAAFGDPNEFAAKGGMKAHGEAMGRGMVLVMSLWDDHDANMLWLDSNYPLDKDPSEPGVSRGPCSTDSGEPTDVENNNPNAHVTYSNIKFGTIGSTYDGPAPTTTPSGPKTTPDADCPGGNLDHCLSLCPESPANIHDGCVQECNDLC